MDTEERYHWACNQCERDGSQTTEDFTRECAEIHVNVRHRKGSYTLSRGRTIIDIIQVTEAK